MLNILGEFAILVELSIKDLYSLNFVKSGMGSRAMSFDLQIGYIYLILPISFMFMFLVSVELLINLFKKILN